MAYQARNSALSEEDEKARSDANNAKNVRNAADVAIASKNPYGVAIGGAIKGADALTGGKASETIGKAMTLANKADPLGRARQNFSNKLAESGISDKAGKLASTVNGTRQAGAGISPDKQPNQVKNNSSNIDNAGGEQANKSLPSSVGNNAGDIPRSGKDSSEETNSDSLDQESEAEKKDTKTVVMVQRAAIITAVTFLPFLVLIFLLIPVFFAASIFPSDYDDAFGASTTAGEDNGNLAYNTNNKEQKAFFDRINTVKLRYQAQGKSFDAYKIAAVYAVIHRNNSKFEYGQMTESVISEIVDGMFSANMYDKTAFKNNLQTNILPKYASTHTSSYENMADDVLKYIENYESLIGKDSSSSGSTGGQGYTCSSVSSCSYDIKGYYIADKGNVNEALQVKDLYVRLMQCGIGNGHDYGGTFGVPLAGEALVPFEKYILGVAYYKMEPDAPAEAIKAQMIAARSFILARHAAMGGWRTLKQESGRWVIQVASCTQDQVYCDPDQGCSSNDEQWGQVHSGLNHNQGFSKEPMAKDSPFRTYASQTAGEVLVNDKGNIIYTGYLQAEQDQFVSLANKGLNYKQILLQVYNQGSRKYGASDIKQASCNDSGSASCGGAIGDYANWKQKGETWSGIQIGTSGKTIGEIGCNVTSVSMLIAKSGVPTTISDFNPGTFVEALNTVGGFNNGDLQYYPVSKIAPSFQYQNSIYVSGMTREQKLNVLRDILAQGNTYVIAEVAGNTGQHWVAIDYVNGDSIKMMDPGSSATDMWSRYNWANTTKFVYFKVVS